jgi:hypothetical protein
VSKRTSEGQQARQRRERRRRVAISGALAAAAVAAGAVFLTQAQSSDRAGAGSRALPPLDVETGVVHVHGLGVDPGDGVLYAATHSGLFRVPEQGKAVRVANRAQDTMGFSIVGPGRFIGSGHPDFREDDVRPPLLGLIESGDRGETWDRISLHGKADFHALHAAHGKVYGYDSTSGTFMVTEDREDWDRRAQLPMADFAVSPDDPDGLLATTQQGLVRSSDGGRSWAPVPGAPVLVVLAWAEQGPLYGVAPDGTVHRSADGGTTWTAQGQVGGEPEAVTVDVRDGQERLYVAAGERGIVVSADQGRTFTTRYSE